MGCTALLKSWGCLHLKKEMVEWGYRRRVNPLAVANLIFEMALLNLFTVKEALESERIWF